MREKVFFVI